MRSTYYVALTPDGEPFDPVAHRRLDIDPDEVSQNDLESAGRRVISLVTDRADPGLVALAERTWVHIARELADGSLKRVGTGYIDPLTITPVEDDLVAIEVLCSPRDWEAAQAALLQPMKVLPAYDPVLVAPERRDDPVEILDGYAGTVWCDPVTHQFRFVDYFGTGLPVFTIEDPDFPGPQAGPATRPVQQVDVAITVEFLERRYGELSATDAIEDSFDGGAVATLTPDAFEQSWWRVGDVINGDSGYEVTKSTLVRRDPEGVEVTEMGPVHGSSGVYNYVQDPDLLSPEPAEMNLLVTYYEAELEFRYRIEQRRVEVARFSLVNGSPYAAGGSIETLELTCEDVSIDDTTPAWMPDTHYMVGDMVLVGSTRWHCTVEHQSLSSFAYDRAQPDGNGGYVFRWSQMATDSSPIGRRDATSYFLTPRGEQTIQSAMLKARAILAASQRHRPFTVNTELTEDLLDLSAAAVVDVPAPGEPGGRIRGKVTSLEIVSHAEDETLQITIAPSAGSGTAVAGDVVVSPTGADWDRIAYADYGDQQPELFPAVAGQARVDFTPVDQLAYIQARDYSPDDGRTDPKATDPANLLRECVTSAELYMTQIAGRDVMVHEIEIDVEPWSGPWHYGEQV